MREIHNKKRWPYGLPLMIGHVSNVHLDMESHQMHDGLCCFRNSYAF